ncbi:hypothetical protein [Actinacidiphila sp. bgisy145]|uniref:hypothetical protein n=1 Tax=Actinacidiphila sp. bgisy145 TaxID=3413792 RepID=UPI003EBF49AB
MPAPDTTGRHPATQQAARHFTHDHLPTHLAAVSSIFTDAAQRLLDAVQHDGPELTVALRKLLESKDAAVRARLDADA